MNAKEELLKLKDENQAKHLSRFFKTAKGEYGEGDKFLGIKVPVTRNIAKTYYKTISFDELQDMLDNKYHEIRLCALLMMVLIFEKTDKKDDIIGLYLKNVKNINNWDLVDLTAHHIIGKYYLINKDPSIIKNLANSNHLWSNRIAIVSQWSIIKTGEFKLLIELAQKFSDHKHDLIHKAVGWMLREMGKIDIESLYEFLDKNYKKMPRTALRYSLERVPKDKKEYYMKK